MFTKLCFAAALLFSTVVTANEIPHPNVDPDKLMKLFLESKLIHCDGEVCVDTQTNLEVDKVPGVKGFVITYTDTGMEETEFWEYSPFVTALYQTMIDEAK